MNRRRSRPRSRLTGLQGDLADILGPESFEQLIGIAKLRRAWPDIVGTMLAARSEPVQIEQLAEGGQCLWVAVDHASIGQQIRFLRDDIRKACLRQAGVGDLYKIRSRMQPTAGIKPKARAARPKKVPFARKRELALELACIKDRTLRRAAFQARLAQLAYEA